MSNESLTILRANAALGLADAVYTIFGDSEAKGLFYGGRQICIGTGGHSGFNSGKYAVDLADIYQADIFAGNKTLSWRRTGGETGLAVLLAYGAASTDPDCQDWEEAGSTAGAFAIDQQHLIWGECDVHDHNWTHLSAARLGSLPVPVVVPKDHKAVLCAKAWFCPRPEACGNPQFVGRNWGPFKVIRIPGKRGE